MAAAPKTKTHLIARFVGHPGTERRIMKEDQDMMIGVKGAADTNLIWPAGGVATVDVTDVRPEVLAYINSDENFKITEVEVPLEAPAG